MDQNEFEETELKETELKEAELKENELTESEMQFSETFDNDVIGNDFFSGEDTATSTIDEEIKNPAEMAETAVVEATTAEATTAKPVVAEMAEPVKPEKTKPGKVRRALAFTGKAIAFGAIAGAVMFGVNWGANKLLPQEPEVPSIKVVESKEYVSNKDGDYDAIPMVSQMMDVSTIVDKAMPAAVAITGNVTTTYFSFFGPGYEQQSPVSGSGVIIGQNEKELLIVTNAHVVNEVKDLTVTFIDGSSAPATVKGAKSNKDIAVVAVALNSLEKSVLEDIAIAEVGDSEKLRMGQPVIAIGNALGEGQSSTVGWISALNRSITISGTEYENLIMTDATINPGNSGGALLNAQGQLIGINSAKYVDEKVEGMGYAIPISEVYDIINDLMTREVRAKVDEAKVGYLGISGMNIDSSINQSYGWPIGALITSIGEKSPAEQAGLLKNDIIVGFDKQDITTFEELRALMEYYAEGERVQVDYYRLENGEYVLKNVEVVLGNRKNAK